MLDSRESDDATGSYGAPFCWQARHSFNDVRVSIVYSGVYRWHIWHVCTELLILVYRLTKHLNIISHVCVFVIYSTQQNKTKKLGKRASKLFEQPRKNLPVRCLCILDYRLPLSLRVVSTDKNKFQMEPEPWTTRKMIWRERKKKLWTKQKKNFQKWNKNNWSHSNELIAFSYISLKIVLNVAR